MDKLIEEVKKLQLSEDAKLRILNQCRARIITEQENESMKKNNVTTFKKPLIVVATLAVCFCLTGITAFAATGKLQGFFRDEKRFDGAVIGTTYQNATDEILFSADVEGRVLIITADMLKYNEVPYSEIEILELKNYRILNEEGKVILANVVPENIVTENHQVKFRIPVGELTKGAYKLELDALSGSKKADADILIYGNWECEFTK